MERKRMLYIACPYWDEDSIVRVHRADAVTALATELIARGYYAYSPVTHGHEIAKSAADCGVDIDEDFWLNHSLEMLTTMAGSVLVLFSLPGYLQSKGVKAEYELAVKYHRPVVAITYSEENYWCHVVDPARSYPSFDSNRRTLNELKTIVEECSYDNVPTSQHS